MRLSHREILRIIQRAEKKSSNGIIVKFDDGSTKIVDGGTAVDLALSEGRKITAFSGSGRGNGLLPELLTGLIKEV